MDDAEFKRILSEVAEWRMPKVSETEIAKSRKMARGKHKPITEDQEFEMGVELIDGVNPTVVPILIKLKPCATVCEDCGKHCPNGREVTAKVYPSRRTGYHWRKRCVTCQRYLNKDTGEYTVPDNNASNHYNPSLKPGHQVTFENDQEIITINCERTQSE